MEKRTEDGTEESVVDLGGYQDATAALVAERKAHKATRASLEKNSRWLSDAVAATGGKARPGELPGHIRKLRNKLEGPCGKCGGWSP